MVPAADPGAVNGAQVRIGALCLSLMGTVLSKLRRTEQEAYY
jgi:hypothetical protein